MRLRLVLVSLGAFLALWAVLLGALLWSTPKRRHNAMPGLQGCVRYFLVPVEWICGKKVIWVNPDGSHVLLGNADQLRMPRPRPVQR